MRVCERDDLDGWMVVEPGREDDRVDDEVYLTRMRIDS